MTALLVCLVSGGAGVAGEVGVRKGASEVVFTERWPESNLRNVSQRMQHGSRMSPPAGSDYQINDETYSVYVPPDYNGDAAYKMTKEYNIDPNRVYVSGDSGGGRVASILAIAKKRGRYVLLTGDHDGNRAQTQDCYEHGYKKKLRRVLYIQVRGMGHQMPPAQWYEKAIVFLDTAMATTVNIVPRMEPDWAAQDDAWWWPVDRWLRTDSRRQDEVYE